MSTLDTHGNVHDDAGKFSTKPQHAASYDLEQVVDPVTLDGPGPIDVPDTSLRETRERATRERIEAIASTVTDMPALRRTLPHLSESEIAEAWDDGGPAFYPLNTIAAAKTSLVTGSVDRSVLESVGLDDHSERTDASGDLIPAQAEADLEQTLDDLEWQAAVYLDGEHQAASQRNAPVYTRSLARLAAAETALADAEAAADEDDPTPGQRDAIDTAQGNVAAQRYVSAILTDPSVVDDLDGWAPHTLPTAAARRVHDAEHAGAATTPAVLYPHQKSRVARHLHALSRYHRTVADAEAEHEGGLRITTARRGQADALAAAAEWVENEA